MHIYPPILAYYSYFNASIGFNLDALIAGIIPNTIPINIEKIKDIITTSLGTETPKYDESDGVWDLSINP